jgi:hypothetical protein
MFRKQPKERIETGEIPAVGRTAKSPLRQKGRTADRSLTIFKSLVLAALMTVTLYGMLDEGLFSVEQWLPVTVSILGLFFISLFITQYFADTPRIAWVLVGFLAALVVVKGLSLTWTISRTDTVHELLRSSMYLAAFVLAAASLSSRRLVGPFIDGMALIAGAVAGYGVLQKTNPVEYPTNTPDGVRISSTLGYPNTTAVVLGMGVTLGLGRMTQLKNPVARGLYAALILVLGAILYFTFSRGGMLALGVGLVVLFALSESRLQMFTNLLLVCGPLAWLTWRAQDLDTFFSYVSDEGLALADGRAFLKDLIIAVFAAFLLQVGYAVVVERYELVPNVRRYLGAAAVAAVLVGAGSLGYLVVSQQIENGGLFGTFATGIEEPEQANERLTSLSSNSRSVYWRIAWEEWKEHPLTGTGAGTFHYTWLENRLDFGGVRQVHNVYLEQGTETGVFAFLALCGFAGLLAVYIVRAAWRVLGERRLLLSGLTAAVVLYLVSSALEWHWYLPSSTIYFFILAGVTVKFAAGTEQPPPPDETSE